MSVRLFEGQGQVYAYTTGTYKFGNNGGRKRVNISGELPGNITFSNGSTIQSGSIVIDTFTVLRIHGVFNVTCNNGTQQVIVSNGSFRGNK